MAAIPNNCAFEFDGIKVTVKKFRASHTVRLIVHRDGSVVLTCPIRTSVDVAKDFIRDNYGWLKKIIAKTEQSKEKYPTFIEHFQTRKRTLVFRPSENATMFRTRYTDTELLVYYPASYDIRDERLQSFVKKSIVRSLKMEAKEYIPGRMLELANKNHLKFSGLSIGSATCRWGCCSSAGKIVISCFVMVLSDELIDLVLLHELTHLVHFDHSAAFHSMLNDMLPGHNEKELNLLLKNVRLNNLK